MSRSRYRAPFEGEVLGIDPKGRSYLSPPNSKTGLYFYGAIPTETVVVRRGRRSRKGEQGDLIEVVEPSLLRLEPRCLHYGVCGGCTMQHLGATDALDLKVAPHYRYLREAFPGIELREPVHSPKSYAYRTKVELTFLRERSGETALGFHRRGRFDRAVEVKRCWLTTLKAELLEGLRLWAKRHSLVGWDPHTNSGDLRYLLYRSSVSSGQELVALVVNSALTLTPEMVEELKGELQRWGIDGAMILMQSSVAGAVVPDRVEPLYGCQTLEEDLGSLRFELGWNSFFQVNPPAYLRLLDRMKSWRETPPGSQIVDLYCGVGSIGLSLHLPGDQLLGVELVEQAVLDAEANAQRNGIEARFEHRSAEESLNFSTDLLILDPPRSGCHPKLIDRLAEVAQASELFYISCNPYRLPEELEKLKERYCVKRAQAFDFFPQTHHVELLLQLVRR